MVKVEFVVPLADVPIGGGTSLGTFELTRIEPTKLNTVWLCPEHLKPCRTERKGGAVYVCTECGKEYSSWQKTTKGYKLGEEYHPVELNTKRNVGKGGKTKLNVIDFEEIQGYFILGTIKITPLSEEARENLETFAGMVTAYKQAILTKLCYKDGDMEHLIIILPTITGLVFAFEIIAFNRLPEDLTEGMVSVKGIVVDVKVSGEFLKKIPKATAEDLTVDTGIPEEAVAEVRSEKVIRLKAVLEQIANSSSKKKAVAKATA